MIMTLLKKNQFETTFYHLFKFLTKLKVFGKYYHA